MVRLALGAILALTAGCASPTAAPPPLPGEAAESLTGTFTALVLSTQAALDRDLAAYGLTQWGEEQVARERATIPQAVAGWQSSVAGIRRIVVLYGHPGLRRVAVIVQALDEKGVTVPDAHRELEDRVAAAVTMARLEFQKDNPMSSLNETRDRNLPPEMMPPGN